MAKILIIKDSSILPLTGQEKKIRMAMLADELLARKHTVTWFCSTFNHYDKSLYFKKDTEVNLSDRYRITLKHAGSYKKNISLRRLIHHKRLSFRLKKYLQDKGKEFDIIVVCHPTVELATCAVKFSKRTSIPVIVDVRDMWPETFSNSFPNFLKPFVNFFTMRIKKMSSYSFKNSTELVSMSKWILNWAMEYGNRSKSGHVFPLGTSLPRVIEIINKKNNLSDERLVCTFVGSLNNSWDLKLIIDTAKQLEKRCIFKIVGDGDFMSYYKSRIISRNIELVGWVQKDQVKDYLLSADILLMPLSNKLAQHVFPNKIFDYLWAAKPVLAACKGEIADLIQNEKLGYVYKYHSKEDFLKGIDYLSEPCRRQEISNRMRSLYKERFNSDKIYTEYADLIEGYL